MFSITSTHALTWPGLKFKLKKGENKFADDGAIPVEAREKLARFRKSGILQFDAPKAWGVEDKAPSDEAKPEGEGSATAGSFDAANIELTTESLSKLTMEQLRLVAAELEVDVAGLKKKAEVMAAVLKEASVGTPTT